MSSMLPVPFRAQLRDGYCLPACAQMTLAFLDVEVDQEYLAAVLGTNEGSTPFSRLTRLSQPGRSVLIERDCTIERIIEHVNAGSPVIASVYSLFLSYLGFEDFHAVVIINVTDQAVTVLDPATDSTPKVVAVDAFLAAWIERDCALAVIAKAMSS